MVIDSAALTVHEKAWVASFEAASVTFTVNEKVPDAAGVPLRTPLLVLSVTPDGSEPAEIAHV